jgi:hypothetical protein
MEFADTYDGYRVFGDPVVLGSLAVAARERFARSRELPDALAALRACLFYEYREDHHEGGYMPQTANAYIHARPSHPARVR